MASHAKLIENLNEQLRKVGEAITAAEAAGKNTKHLINRMVDIVFRRAEAQQEQWIVNIKRDGLEWRRRKWRPRTRMRPAPVRQPLRRATPRRRRDAPRPAAAAHGPPADPEPAPPSAPADAPEPWNPDSSPSFFELHPLTGLQFPTLFVRDGGQWRPVELEPEEAAALWPECGGSA